MRAQTIDVLDGYYADLLGVGRASLWNEVTVWEHSGRLLAFDGLYVVRRHGGVHVSAPAGAIAATRSALAAVDRAGMPGRSFGDVLASRLGRRVGGPSVHAYLDRDPGPVPEVGELSRADLASLSATAGIAEWAESGWDDDPVRLFGLVRGGRLVAAANLNVFHGLPRDIGVLVDPSWRGHGLALPVAQHAASVAVRESGFARWGARVGNRASTAVCRRLGFEPWCTQATLR